MKWLQLVTGLALFLMTLGTPQVVRACPLCAEAIANSSTGDDDDKDDFPAAMNQSIYLMIGVPYMAFGVFGLMIYRGVKMNEAFVKARRDDADQNQSPA